MKTISKWFSKDALAELRKMGIELDDNYFDIAKERIESLNK